MNAPHPMVLLREVATNPRQIAASQYERTYHAPGAFCEGGCKIYLADPTKVPASLEDGRDLLTPRLAAHLLAGVEIEPATPALAVRVPTLVVWGMQDPALLPGLLDGLGDYVADLTILRVADSGSSRSSLSWLIRRSGASSSEYTSRRRVALPSPDHSPSLPAIYVDGRRGGGWSGRHTTSS